MWGKSSVIAGGKLGFALEVWSIHANENPTWPPEPAQEK